MPQPRLSGNSFPSLTAVKGRPLAMPLQVGDRRNHVRRAALVHRITCEFREMPGLILSIAQASRLLGVDQAACERILASLAKEGLLRRRQGGTYGLAGR
jgi:hypothetical protein